MLDGSTIVAVSTAPGRSSRALLRVSGPATGHLLDALTCPAPAPTRGLARCHVNMGAGRSIPSLAARFVGPASYTGEDAAEILIPGSPHVSARVVALAAAEPGVRPARAGEFTARAFMNGRLSIDQARGVGLLVAAATRAEHHAALRLLSGAEGALYRGWADRLTGLLAGVEAGIDFSDHEDVPTAPADRVARAAADLAATVRDRVASARGSEAPAESPLVVLAGRPNAGKSTLFNRLLGRPRAVASPEAGTTRDVLEEPLDLRALGAGVVRLADTAGAGDQPDLPRHTADALGRAAVILHCDPRGEFAPIARAGVPGSRRATVIRVRTMADRPGVSGPCPGVVEVCSLDGRGVADLRRAIAAGLASPGAADSPEAAATGLAPHQRVALVACADWLAGISPADEPAVQAAALRAALDELGELVGRVGVEDLLDRVFATFCIGK